MSTMDDLSPVTKALGSVRKVMVGAKDFWNPCQPEPKITIYDNAMELLSPTKVPPGCCFPFGCCIFDRKMILRHRLLGGAQPPARMPHQRTPVRLHAPLTPCATPVLVAVSKRRVVYYPCCCCPSEAITFKLAKTSAPKSLQDFFEPNEIDFKTSISCGTAKSISQDDLNMLYEFVYGDVTTSQLAEGAHALAVLVNDGVLPEPRVKASVDVKKGPDSATMTRDAPKFDIHTGKPLAQSL